MSLRPYVGEYLVSPVPLHFGLNVCSHGCFYCFANLNNPERRADNADIRWLAKWTKDQDSTLVGWLLARGYPLLVSNDSDPLAASNEETFLTLHDICERKGIPLCYQTKGGKPEMQELILSGRPTMLYITITSDKPDILRAAEPGAPGFEHRMKLAIEARRRGHHVVIGINPLERAWWNDFEGFARRLADAGIRHVWAGTMHLNYKQIANIPAKTKTRFGDVIDTARSKNHLDGLLRMDLEDAGINIFEGNSADRPGFWQPYFDLGYPWFPTLDGFFHDMNQAAAGAPVAVSLAAFNRWADIGCPLTKAAFKEYLNSFGRSARNIGERTEAKSYADVHAWYFRMAEFPTPLRHDRLFLAAEQSADGTETILSAGGHDVLIYAPGEGKTGDLTWRIDNAPVVWLEE